MKKYLFGLFAAAIAVTSFAFTTLESKRALVWYSFIGNPDVESSILNPANYTSVGSTAPTCPAAADLCAIRVDDGTEVYTSGANIGKPRVDVAGQLQIDVLDATDFDGSSTGQNPVVKPNRVILKAE